MGNLADNLTEGSLNTSLWTVGQIGGGQSISVSVLDTTSGLQITPFANAGSIDAYNGIYSTATYNLSNGAVFVHAMQTAVGSYADTSLDVRPNSSSMLTIDVENGTIYFQKIVAGAKTTLLSQPYSSTSHAWWRIREASGTVYWETAPDGSTWTTQAQAPDPFSVTSIQVDLNAGTYQSVATPGQAIFNNLNVSPTTSAATATAMPTATTATTMGTVYWSGDFSTGDWSQYPFLQAGQHDSPEGTYWQDNNQTNSLGNTALDLVTSPTRHGTGYSAKLTTMNQAAVQQLADAGASMEVSPCPGVDPPRRVSLTTPAQLP